MNIIDYLNMLSKTWNCLIVYTLFGFEKFIGFRSFMILMRSLYVDFYVAENKSVIRNLHCMMYLASSNYFVLEFMNQF